MLTHQQRLFGIVATLVAHRILALFFLHLLLEAAARRVHKGHGIKKGDGFATGIQGKQSPVAH